MIQFTKDDGIERSRGGGGGGNRGMEEILFGEKFHGTVVGVKFFFYKLTFKNLKMAPKV